MSARIEKINITSGGTKFVLSLGNINVTPVCRK